MSSIVAASRAVSRCRPRTSTDCLGTGPPRSSSPATGTGGKITRLARWRRIRRAARSDSFTVADPARRRREHGPTQPGDGDTGRAPVAPRDGRLAQAALTRVEVLAGRLAAGEADGRVGPAVPGGPRPDREGHAPAAARAAARDVAPGEPPRVAGGELEARIQGGDPPRPGASRAERLGQRVPRPVARAAGEEGPGQPAGAERQPALPRARPRPAPSGAAAGTPRSRKAAKPGAPCRYLSASDRTPGRSVCP